MPQGYQPQAVLHDPFTLPPTASAVQPVSPEATAAGKVKPAKTTKTASKPGLILTGIVVSGNNRVAIIQNGKESRSYQIGELVGSYQLRRIDDKSVLLAGPSGELVLFVGGSNGT